MPSRKFEWLQRIKAVEREYTAIRFATEFLLEESRRDSNLLQNNLRVRDVDEAVEHLEGTYLIRLFSEFETSLRIFWLESRGVDAPSRTRDLLDGIGAKRRIPYDQIQNAHQVREYRNLLVHERDQVAVPLSVSSARSYLCVFLSFLPWEW